MASSPGFGHAGAGLSKPAPDPGSESGTGFDMGAGMTEKGIIQRSQTTGGRFLRPSPQMGTSRKNQITSEISKVSYGLSHLMTVLVIIDFPIALVLASAYEFTPVGGYRGYI
jgi:hypothetical protein